MPAQEQAETMAARGKPRSSSCGQIGTRQLSVFATEWIGDDTSFLGVADALDRFIDDLYRLAPYLAICLSACRC